MYRHSRPASASKLISFVHSDVIDVESRKRILDSLNRVAKFDVDFGDGYLAATAAESRQQSGLV